MGSPVEKDTSDLVRVSVTVDSPVSQDMPDDDQDFASDDSDGFLRSFERRQAGKAVMPVRRVAYGGPSDLNESGAEFSPTSLGDGTGTRFLTRSPDRGSKTSITDEMFVGREAGDIADGAQKGHGGDETNTRHLQ